VYELHSNKLLEKRLIFCLTTAYFILQIIILFTAGAGKKDDEASVK
jgi:hypothetical protein